MKLSCMCVYVTVTGSQMTLALCEQWPVGLYSVEQDTEDVGSDSLHTPSPHIGISLGNVEKL